MGEAACRGRERVGKLAACQFRIQHVALKVAADLWATASSTDLIIHFYVLLSLCVWVYAIVRLWGRQFVCGRVG